MRSLIMNDHNKLL